MNVRELIVAHLVEVGASGLRNGDECICMTKNLFANCASFCENGVCEPFYITPAKPKEDSPQPIIVSAPDAPIQIQVAIPPAPTTTPVPASMKRPAFLAKERCQVCGVEKTGLYMTNCMVCGTRVCRSCSEEIEDDVPMCPACAGKAREAKK